MDTTVYNIPHYIIHIFDGLLEDIVEILRIISDN